MNNFARGLLIGLLLALVPATVLATSPLPISVATAVTALKYAEPAADNTETFYETVAQPKSNASTAVGDLRQVQKVLNTAGYHGRDAEIADIENSLAQASALSQQAHDVGQHADNLAQALKRDLMASAGTPQP